MVVKYVDEITCMTTFCELRMQLVEAGGESWSWWQQKLLLSGTGVGAYFMFVVCRANTDETDCGIHFDSAAVVNTTAQNILVLKLVASPTFSKWKGGEWRRTSIE